MISYLGTPLFLLKFSFYLNNTYKKFLIRLFLSPCSESSDNTKPQVGAVLAFVGGKYIEI